MNEPISACFSRTAKKPPTRMCVEYFFSLLVAVFNIIIYGNLDYSMYARIA